MPFDHISTLTAWMRDAGIGELELTGPEARLRLSLEDGADVVVETADPAPAVEIIAAPTVGVFLHRHPMSDVPLVEVGTEVAAGRIVGLLAIGSLLVPVVAACDGILAEMTCAHGETAGYGTALATLHPFET